jgi:diguanylate cyclase (GGDEF)-like protein/PAS domain S-box-containing protein
MVTFGARSAAAPIGNKVSRMSASSTQPDPTQAGDLQGNFERIVDSAAEGIYGLDLDGRVTFVNPAAERLTGWTRQEQLGQHQHELIHHTRADGSRCPAAACPILATLQDGHARRADDIFWHRDGTSFPVAWTSAPWYDQAGAIVGVVVTFIDVSPRVDEHRYRSLLAASSDFVWRTTPDGRLVWVSDAWLHLTGLTRAAAAGFGCRAGIAEDDRPGYDEALQQALANASVFEHEYRLVGAVGREHRIFDRGVPVTDETGRVIEWIGAGQDVTERRELQEAARRQHERYRTLVESNWAIVWEADPESFRFTFVSCEAENLLGYPPERWTEASTFWVDHMHPDDRAWAPDYCRRATAEMQAHEFDYRMIAADGRVVWLRDFVNVIVEDGRPSKLVGVMVDVTRTKHNEQALEYVSGLQRNLVEITGALVAAAPGEIDDAITAALRRLGEYCGVDRSYLLDIDGDFAALTSTLEWSAAGVAPLNLKARPRDNAPHMMHCIANGELLQIPRVGDLGPEWAREKEILCAQHVHSTLLVPVIANAVVEAYIGFDAVHGERQWSGDEIRLLRGLAEVIGATIQRDRADRARRESEGLLAIAGRTARVGGWSVDLANDRFIWSDEACAIHDEPPGTTLTVEQAIGYCAPEWRDYARTLLEGCSREGTPFEDELEVITATGRRIWLRVIGEAVTSDDGIIRHLRGALQDITEQKQAQQDIQRLAERLTTTLESITDAFLTIDRDWRYTYANQEAERLTGQGRDALLGHVVWDACPELRGSQVEREFRRAMTEDRTTSFEYYYPGGERWLEINASPSAEGLAVYFRDITDRKRAEAEIEFFALYDPLTHLPNRRLLIDRLQHAIAASGRAGQYSAVLFLDLDHFKTLNDTLGHDIGDRMLQAVATRLTDCLRDSDTVARFGGDEFAVIAGELGQGEAQAVEQAQRISDKIRASLTRPYELGDHERRTTTSIGVTLFCEADDTTDDIMKRADLAMYQAKDAGRGTMRVFDPAMRDAMHTRMALEAGVREGIERDEFAAYYQCQVDATGAVVGAEALARWHHPERGLVGPGEFIPLAEETGLIKPLGETILERVCRRLADWASDPVRAQLAIAVNVSAHQFHHPGFVDRVKAILEHTGAPAERLLLELTESLLLTDIEDTITKMDRLKAAGVRFALDDFGTGYSSLSYLKRLPLDQLKIDQTFVRDALTDANDAAIVRTIIVLAQTMELEVIAEGVETEAVRTLLADNGCSRYQGFLYSHPLPIDEFERRFRAH